MRSLRVRTAPAVLLALLLAGPTLAEPLAPDVPRGPVPWPEPSWLRVDGERIVDEDGRVALLRGVNVIEKHHPFVPWHGEREFERMRAWGFTVVRLGLSWEAVEPDPGRYDDAYLDKMAALVARAKAHGLHVVLDMHQDVWGPETGGNGAPDHACDSQLPHANFAGATGAWQAGYFSPAAFECFAEFWASPALQDRFAAMWRHVAARYADEPAVLGFDLLNEPFPTLPPGAFEALALGPFYARVAAAVREVAPRQIIFFEPAAQKSALMPSPWLAAPVANAVYAPHLYGESEFTGRYAGDPGAVRASLEATRVEARAMGVPMWVGELGVPSSVAGSVEYADDVLALLDAAAVGGAWWEYRRDEGGFGIEHPDGREKPVLDVLDRPYLLRTAGEPLRASFDVASGRFEADVRPASEGETLLRVPPRHYPSGFALGGDACWDATFDARTRLLALDGARCGGREARVALAAT